MKKIVIALSLIIGIALMWLLIKTPQETTQSLAIITTLSHPALEDAQKGFIEIVAPLGLQIKKYNAEGNVQQANLIAEKVASDSSIVGIFAIGTLAAQTMAQKEQHKPIVIAAVSDPKAILDPLPKNISGLSDGIDATYQIETILKLLPIKSVSLLYSPHEANAAFMVKNLEQAAIKAGLMVHLVGVYDAQGIMNASLNACKKADAVVIPLDNQLVSAMPMVIKATKDYACPIITSNESPIHQGASIAFGIDYQTSGRDAGHIMKRLLKDGHNVNDIGIETAKTVALYVNKAVLISKKIKLNDVADLDLITIDEATHD